MASAGGQPERAGTREQLGQRSGAQQVSDDAAVAAGDLGLHDPCLMVTTFQAATPRRRRSFPAAPNSRYRPNGPSNELIMYKHMCYDAVVPKVLTIGLRIE